MIKAVIFDLDDTLISEKEYVKSGFKEVAKKISEEYKLDKNRIYGLLLDVFEENPNNVFNKVLNKLNIPYKNEYIKFLVNTYREHKPDITLYDDAKYIIDTLYKNDIKLGIITDGYKITQRNKLEALNIDKYFEYIIVTDELGRQYWKPNSKSYEIMKDKLKIDYKDMIYVGDNVLKDFVTANKLGIYTILIKRERGIYSQVKMDKEYLANLEVISLNELEKFIESKVI